MELKGTTKAVANHVSEAVGSVDLGQVRHQAEQVAGKAGEFANQASRKAYDATTRASKEAARVTSQALEQLRRNVRRNPEASVAIAVGTAAAVFGLVGLVIWLTSRAEE